MESNLWIVHASIRTLLFRWSSFFLSKYRRFETFWTGTFSNKSHTLEAGTYFEKRFLSVWPQGTTCLHWNLILADPAEAEFKNGNPPWTFHVEDWLWNVWKRNFERGYRTCLYIIYIYTQHVFLYTVYIYNMDIHQHPQIQNFWGESGVAFLPWKKAEVVKEPPSRRAQMRKKEAPTLAAPW